MKQIFKNRIFGLGVILISIIAFGIIGQGCQQEDFWTDSTLSKDEYKSILKKEIDGLIAKSGRLEESFFFLHGMPVWESAKWVSADSKEMLVVPLLSSSDQNKKYIVGIVKNEKILAVITELSEADTSKNRICSLNNQILYDGRFPASRPRLKSGYEIVENLLLNGGGVYDLFHAIYGSYASYSPQAIAGTLCIVVGYATGSIFDMGHAWMQFTDDYGDQTTTFGLWPESQGGYQINHEYDSSWNSWIMSCTTITCENFQSILNYNTNANANNLDYNVVTNNCANYAAGIWQVATGTGIVGIAGGGFLTPGDIENWFN
jgi:hypothetical protein